jgi:hypothetical protein
VKKIPSPRHGWRCYQGKNRRFLMEFAQQTPKLKNRHGWRFFSKTLDKPWEKSA